MIHIRNILAPTDFSTPSRHALNYARELALRFEAQLHLVTVVENVIPLVPEAGMLFSQQAEGLVAQQQAARQALEKLAREDAGLKGLNPRLHVLAGNVSTEILALARLQEIDLLVMGTHGRTGLSHLVMGSVAEKLVRLSTCPVLTVRPEGHQFVSG